MKNHKYSDDCTCTRCVNKFKKTLFSNCTMEVQCDHCEKSYNGQLKKNETIANQWLKIKHKKDCKHIYKEFNHDICRGGSKATDNQLLSDCNYGGKEHAKRKKKLLQLRKKKKHD